MKTVTNYKGANGFAITGALIFLSMLSACASGAGDKSNVNGVGAPQSSENNSIQVAAVSPTPAINAPPNDKPGAVATAPGRKNGNAQPSSMPQPQIGTGGNDFFQFTKARAAIDADPDLKSTNIVIDVKDGVLTMSGTVASADQKLKAERLMSGVAGFKKVNNRLQITK